MGRRLSHRLRIGNGPFGGDAPLPIPPMEAVQAQSRLARAITGIAISRHHVARRPRRPISPAGGDEHGRHARRARAIRRLLTRRAAVPVRPGGQQRPWLVQAPQVRLQRLIRDPLEALCIALADRFGQLRLPLVADPKRSPFRIYRDVRFSKDKSPYKTAQGADFPWQAARRRGSATRRGGRLLPPGARQHLRRWWHVASRTRPPGSLPREGRP